MAADIRIQCIHRSDRYGAHERISHIGGVTPGGKRWKLSHQQAIAEIEAAKYRFYVREGGNWVWVTVATSAAGYKYLKTQADAEHPNTLLSLPECPYSVAQDSLPSD